MNAVLGILLHALGGFAAGSFYIPYKKVKDWSWETYWLTQGFASWIIAPIIGAIIFCPNLCLILTESPPSSMFYSFLFGVLWGAGGLTFGLSMRYLGISLGYSLALGFCTMFGTLIPPIHAGRAMDLLTTPSGLAVLIGVAVCLAGITVCGYAGYLKEHNLSDEEKKKAIREFALTKGVFVAIFAGVMSACFAFALEAGKPIAEIAIQHGTNTLYQNNPVFIFAMGGGFTTNAVWCLFLSAKNRSFKDYCRPDAPLTANYLLAFAGGVIWYLQFFFYGMGTSRLGRTLDFASWSIHMAFIIVFSNLWGLYFKEWKGSGRKTIRMILTGILILILSAFIIGLGSYIEQH